MNNYTIYLLYTLLASCFASLCTTIGASSVYFVKNNHPKINSFLLSFASGIMVAGAFFSLILPAIEMTSEYHYSELIMICLGCVVGFAFMLVSQLIITKIDKNNTINTKMIAMSITLHNIPEGMCMGIAMAGAMLDPSLLTSAVALAIGIGFQNIPEGASVSLPMYVNNHNKNKSFLSGMLSGIVEPIFAVIAYLLASYLTPVLPFLLCMASTCMVYVSLSQLMPDAYNNDRNMASIGMSIGFMMMLMLDVLL